MNKTLVVDLGFSAAKYLYGDKKKGLIKSCYRKINKDADGSYQWQGSTYLVGEKALLETGSRYLRTIDELIGMYPLFVACAANKAGISEADTLVVGLPYTFWHDENQKQKKGKSNAIDTLIRSLESFEVNGVTHSFGSVIVFPQGLGGIKAYLNGNGAVSHDNILGIDIGFNTVIYNIYSTEEKEILTGGTYYKKGLHDMAVNHLDISAHLPGRTLTPIEINYIILTGKIQVGFDLIDVRPEIETAVSTYIQDLLQLILGDLKAHGGVITFDTVLFFGGGARLIDGLLSSAKINVVIQNEPEYANARGFLIKANELEVTGA